MPFGGSTDSKPGSTTQPTNDANGGGNPTNYITNEPGGLPQKANTAAPAGGNGPVNGNAWSNPWGAGLTHGVVPSGADLGRANHQPTVGADGSLQYPENPYTNYQGQRPGALNGDSGTGGGSASTAGSPFSFGYTRNDGSPDYFGSAYQQSQAGQQNVNSQTAANRPNQTNAYGSQQQWSYGPDGQLQLNQSFGGALGQAGQNYQQQFLQNSQTPLDNGSAARDSAITGAYGQATSRLNPQFAQQGDALNAQLANQGLSPGTAAYRTAQQQFGQQKNDAYSSAMNGAIAQGTAAQQATFGENLAAQQYPLQQLQGMQGFLGQAGFNSAGMAQAPNYLGAAQNAGNYQLGQASNSNQVLGDVAGGVAQLGTAAANAYGYSSDERLKQNITRHPVEAAPGVPVATWEYKAQPGVMHRGVIAQDMEKAGHSQYVHKDEDGIRSVDYSFSPFLFK